MFVLPLQQAHYFYPSCEISWKKGGVFFGNSGQQGALSNSCTPHASGWLCTYVTIYILMYLYWPNFFIHRSIVLVQVSFVFVCTHTHLSVYPAAEGLRSVSYFKNDRKKNKKKKTVSDSSHYQRDFECVMMIFYLYFCTKSIKGGSPAASLFTSTLVVQACRGGTIWPHTVFTVFTHLLLKRHSDSSFHQPSKQSAAEAPPDCVSSPHALKPLKPEVSKWKIPR